MLRIILWFLKLFFRKIKSSIPRSRTITRTFSRHSREQEENSELLKTSIKKQLLSQPKVLLVSGVYYIDDKDNARAQNNTVDFSNTNTNPFSLMYYAVGYVPLNLSTTDPSTFSTRALLVALRFNDPLNPSQPSYNTTFSKLLAGFTPMYKNVFNSPCVSATQLVDLFFPYSFRRGFYGPQTTKISART
ncbi:hypothetical protein BDZ45DRAFT_262179 [Acephala macrosclerotiorum]|nr:hypothetical protein BDZ45DRAFT_262179 [Acephala macrosclerotiorum]